MSSRQYSDISPSNNRLTNPSPNPHQRINPPRNPHSFPVFNQTAEPSSSFRSPKHTTRSKDLRWIPIPLNRPHHSPHDKFNLTNLLLPKPSLEHIKSTSKATRNITEREGQKSVTSLRRRSSKIWLRAKEVTMKATRQNHANTQNTKDRSRTIDNELKEQVEHGRLEMTSEEEWEIITPPLTSSEFSNSSETRSNPSIEPIDQPIEEEMLVGARGTGTISRVSQRAQQGSSNDILDSNMDYRISSISSISKSISMSKISNSASGSGSGSGSGERSLELYLTKHKFPIPPSHRDQNDKDEAFRVRPNIHTKKSWLDGGPLTLLEDSQELERKLPEDHPFNSPNPSSKSSDNPSQISNSRDCDAPPIPSRFPDADQQENNSLNSNKRYSYLTNLLQSLEMLRETLYNHNLESIKILNSSEDILPPSIISGIEKRLDKYWIKWANILNSTANRISDELNSLSPSLNGQSDKPSNPQNHQNQYLKHLIPPPLTSDEIEKLIWTLEEKGKIASGTYKRMFGLSNFNKERGRIEIKKLTEEEENQADHLGLRDWMIGEEQRLEREFWRNK